MADRFGALTVAPCRAMLVRRKSIGIDRPPYRACVSSAAICLGLRIFAAPD
jgi:hypothetical protein